MRNALLAAAALAAGVSTAALAQDMTVGVSWSNFQEERWKTDEAAIKAALDVAGATYMSADAQASAAKQLTDVEALIAQGADALIILAMDKDAIGPAVDKAAAEGIPALSSATYTRKKKDKFSSGAMIRKVRKGMPRGE